MPENLRAGGCWVALSSIVGGLDDNAAPLGLPIQYSLAPIKRAQSWGVDVDYEGGASGRRADVGVCC